MSGTPDMQELMRRAQEMQKQMQRAQQELVALKVTGTAGGNLVEITMNGAHQALKVKISFSLIDSEEPNMVEDLVLAAINDASKKIEEATRQKMLQMAKDMNLPTDIGGTGTGGTGSGGAGAIGGA